MADDNQASELVFVALGGLGEIGMNMALYGYGPPARRKWLMVDCGLAFAAEDTPGIDLVLPDIAFIEKYRQDLVGIVITHAHEDHIGALVDLWPKLGVKVHATRFAADLLEVRRLGEPGAPDIPVTVVPSRARWTLGPFDCEFVDVAHSIPESNALVIRTPAGTVVHSGDWKIDPTPVLGRPTDEARFRAIGQEGVLALVCDSTNAVRDGESPSEAAVTTTLTDLIKSAPARVAVTTFASNVARLRAVAEAAMAAGREVVIAGRAMERVVGVARELGMLDGIPPFRGLDSYQRIPRDKIVVLVTGSQGEQRAALARIATNEHPTVSFGAGDRVIFSSRAIPGNERGINRIIDGLIDQGVEVITDRTHLVHVSGHPRRGEMARLYEWLKPAIAIPAHGEALHLEENAGLARSLGVPTVISARNGDMVRLAPGPASVLSQIKTGRLLKDGEILIGAGDETIRERRKLAAVGMISVAVALDKRGEVMGAPEIAVMGLPTRAKSGADMAGVVVDAVDELLDSLPKARRRDPDVVEAAIERAVRHAVENAWGKKPACHVLVVTV